MTTIDRRTALTGLAGASSIASLRGAAAAVGTAGVSVSSLGHWGADGDSLPVYVFTGDVPVTTTTPAGHPYGLEIDPVFLLGNYDLTLFAYASGRLLFISGEHGWVRLNEPTATVPGNAARLTVTGNGSVRTHDLLGPDGVCASGRSTTRAFGCGAARYRLTPEPGLTVERILSVAPSTATLRAQPAVVVTNRLTNTGKESLDLDYVETILSNPNLMLHRAPADRKRPVTFVNVARPMPGDRGVMCDATATSDDPSVLTPVDTPNQYNLYPPSLALMSAPMAGGAAVEFGQHAMDGGRWRFRRGRASGSRRGPRGISSWSSR